jgi:hypothetical protein
MKRADPAVIQPEPSFQKEREMKTMDHLRQSLEQSQVWMLSLVGDIKDAPLTAPTPKGGNHPLWVVGHLAHSEAGMVAGFIQGEQNPLSRWDGLFGAGTQPVADASHYPGLDEVLAEYHKVRAATLQLLSTLSEADLDKPSRAPAHLASFFGTVGQCLLMLPLHQTFHSGQVADARHAAGRKPLFG